MAAISDMFERINAGLYFDSVCGLPHCFVIWLALLSLYIGRVNLRSEKCLSGFYLMDIL